MPSASYGFIFEIYKVLYLNSLIIITMVMNGDKYASVSQNPQ